MAPSKEPVTLDGFNTVQALRRSRTAPPARDPGGPLPPAETERPAATPAPQQARIRHTTMPIRHTIHCYHCGFEFVHTGRLEKVLCPKCRTFLNADPHTIAELWSGRLQTLGTVTIAAAGHVKSGEVAAMDLILHGRVSGGRVDVMRRLELFAGSSMDLALFRYADLVVHQGMTLAPADPIRCGAFTVAGEVEAVVECTGCVTIAGTALFRGSIRAPSLIVEDGATMEADVAVAVENETTRQTATAA